MTAVPSHTHSDRQTERDRESPSTHRPIILPPTHKWIHAHTHTDEQHPAAVGERAIAPLDGRIVTISAAKPSATQPDSHTYTHTHTQTEICVGQ